MNPTMECLICGTKRDCFKHMRAEHPPTAAKRWLRQHCPYDYEMAQVCEIVYQASIEIVKVPEVWG